MVTMIGDELPSHSCSGWPHVGLCPTFLVLSLSIQYSCCHITLTDMVDPNDRSLLRWDVSRMVSPGLGVEGLVALDPESHEDGCGPRYDDAVGDGVFWRERLASQSQRKSTQRIEGTQHQNVWIHIDPTELWTINQSINQSIRTMCLRKKLPTLSLSKY